MDTHSTDAGGTLAGFYEIYGNSRPRLSNEQRLLLAMLVDTIEVMQAGPPPGRYDVKRRTYDEAVAWVRKTGITAGAGGFSFDFTCDSLGIEPTLLRALLLHHAAKNTASIETARRHTETSQRPHVWIRGPLTRAHSDTPRCQ